MAAVLVKMSYLFVVAPAGGSQNSRPSNSLGTIIFLLFNIPNLRTKLERTLSSTINTSLIEEKIAIKMDSLETLNIKKNITYI